MERKKILVVGSLVTDLIFETERMPSAGQTIFGRSFSQAPGGKGANQAVQIGKLGVAAVDMVGRVGDDAFGRQLIKACQSAGVGVENIFATPKISSGISDVILEKNDDSQIQNRIIMTKGANEKLSIEDLSFLESIIDQYHLIVMQLEIPFAIDLYVAKLAKKHGITVVFNPAPSCPLNDEMYQLIDYIIPNETEVFDLTGIRPLDNQGQPNLNNLYKAYLFFGTKGVKNTIITLGHHGVYFANDKQQILVPALKNIQVIDPTAAGDSFIGAFSSAIINDITPIEALKFANFVAAITVTSLGAMPSLPTLAEVVARAKKTEYQAINETLNHLLMINQSKADPLESYKKSLKEQVDATITHLNEKIYAEAVKLILEVQEKGNRVHVTGIGKPAHICQYYASLLSSTGTPAYFLHGTEAVHGSAGQLVKGDVVIAVSNSGETPELKATITTILNNDCYVIGVSGNTESWLAKMSHAHLFAGVNQEGDDLNRAPRNSIIAELIVLQGLSIILQARFGLSPKQYVKWHPGGKLGQLRNEEK